MVIDALSIPSYKGAHSFELIPGKLNVLTGKIGTGKSSVLEAIRFALTGITETEGLKKAEVAVRLLGGKEIRRTANGKSRTVKVEGSTTSQDSVRLLLEESTSVSLDSMKVITSRKLLTSMKSGSLSEFLVTSGLIPMTLDYATVISLCTVPPAVARVLAKTLPQMPAKFGLDDVDAAYKAIYDSRTGLNREIKSTELRARFEGGKPTRALADVDRDLMEIAKSEERQNTYITLLSNYNDAVAGIQKIRSQIAGIESRIKVSTVTSPDEEERKQLAAQDSTLQREIAERKAGIASRSKEIEKDKVIMEKLNTSFCPLHDKLVCNTDKTMIRGAMEVVLKQLAGLQTEDAARIEELKKRSNGIQEKIKLWDEQNRQYQELRRLHDTRKSLMESIPKLPDKPTPPEKETDRIADKQRLSKERALIEAFTRSLTAKRELAELRKELEITEAMLGILSPKSGLREKIIMSVLEPLEQHCNQLAQSLRLDFQISIRVDNGIYFYCKPKATVDFVGLSSVSSGEQALATFLILDMLNSLSGFRLLMMDDLDKLDADALDELLAVLTADEIRERYDHIFLAAVDHNDTLATLQKYETSIDKMINL